MLHCELKKDGLCVCSKPCAKLIYYNRGYSDAKVESEGSSFDEGWASAINTTGIAMSLLYNTKYNDPEAYTEEEIAMARMVINDIARAIKGEV